MVAQTFTTDTFAGTGLIGAIALIKIFFFAAFHCNFLMVKFGIFPNFFIMINPFDQNGFGDFVKVGSKGPEVFKGPAKKQRDFTSIGFI